MCAFHLKNAKSRWKLNLAWRRHTLDHCEHPKYLGVTLDRSLTYKAQCKSLKMKVAARNNIIRKLVSSKWGARPEVLRGSALLLCFSAAEYGCSSWGRSTHANKVDIALNKTCRIITGCLSKKRCNL